MTEKPQSRFWAADDSDNESSSSSSSSNSSNSSDSSSKSKPSPDAPANNKWANMYSDSDSEDDAQRTVKSANRKADESFEKIYRDISHGVDIGDFNGITTSFSQLPTLLTKHVEVTRGQMENYPEYYWRCLQKIQNVITDMTNDKAKQKKLSKTNGKSFNALRARFKKLITDDMQGFIDNLQEEKERQSSSSSESESESSASSSSSSESESGSDDEDDDDWGSSSSSSSSDEDDDQVQLTGRARWLKKSHVPEDKFQKNEDKKQKGKEKLEKAKQRKIQKEEQKEQEETNKEATEQKEEIFTKEKLDEEVEVIMQSRGKKNVDREEMVSKLRELIIKSEEFGDKVKIYLLMYTIVLEFDVTTGLDGYLPVDSWRTAFKDIAQVVEILEANPNYKLSTTNDEDIIVVGDLCVFMERLAEEYEKSLRYIESNSQEYVDRLKDESSLSSLSRRVFNYYVRVGNDTKAAVQAAIILNNNYYKHTSVAALIANDESFSLEKEIASDCGFIYQHGSVEMQCRATLCQVYHYAIHDQYYKARDLLLQSRTQDAIYNTEVPTQILFNRMMVQLGICAFRCGKIKECHQCLVEICQQGNKTKELLAQGVFWRRFTNNIDQKAMEAQQRVERRRMQPYHQHINLDMLEFFHLTSAMLLEIPNMARENEETRVISRTFRRHMDQYNRQIFMGPPENTREHVLAASIAMSEGNWSKCCELLLDLPVWDLQHNVAPVKEMLKQKIKEECLRTYVLTYGSTYGSISADYLCDMFSLEKNQVATVISRMVMHEEVKGSWDQTVSPMVLVLSKTDPTHLQALALQLADKLSSVVESNEVKLSGQSSGFGDGKEDQERNNQGGRRRGGGRGGMSRNNFMKRHAPRVR